MAAVQGELTAGIDDVAQGVKVTTVVLDVDLVAVAGKGLAAADVALLRGALLLDLVELPGRGPGMPPLVGTAAANPTTLRMAARLTNETFMLDEVLGLLVVLVLVST